MADRTLIVAAVDMRAVSTRLRELLEDPTDGPRVDVVEWPEVGDDAASRSSVKKRVRWKLVGDKRFIVAESDRPTSLTQIAASYGCDFRIASSVEEAELIAQDLLT